MAKKSKSEIVKLVCAETGEFYTTKRNKQNTPQKFTFRKYSPKLRKHVEFKEGGKLK